MKAPRRCKLCGGEAAPRYSLPATTIYGCRQCDLHFIDYLDDLAAPAAGADLDAKARQYIEARLPAAAVHFSLRCALLAEHLDLAGAHCLDVGAGVGQFLLLLQQAGAEGVGIEPSRLRRQYALERHGLRLAPEPVESECWREKFRSRFDAATLWEVLEHVNDPLATIRAIHALLKPGGVLCIETPSRTARAYRLSEWSYRVSGGRLPLYLGDFYAPLPFGHKQIFTPGQLLSLLAANGFEVIRRCRTFPAAVQPLLKPCDRLILVARKTAA